MPDDDRLASIDRNLTRIAYALEQLTITITAATDQRNRPDPGPSHCDVGCGCDTCRCFPCELRRHRTRP